MRGYFAVGIYHPKTPQNVGTLWRSASLFGAAFVFTVGARYQRQASDTCNTPAHTPMFHFACINDLHAHPPHLCPLVGVELDPRARPLRHFNHFERSAYLLGAEDHGLPPAVLDRCHAIVQIETAADWSMNVAAAGTVLLYDRHVKMSPKLAVLP